MWTWLVGVLLCYDSRFGIHVVYTTSQLRNSLTRQKYDNLQINLCSCRWQNTSQQTVTEVEINGWQLAKMKKSITDMSLP